jgi:hypothetical protein
MALDMESSSMGVKQLESFNQRYIFVIAKIYPAGPRFPPIDRRIIIVLLADIFYLSLYKDGIKRT